MIVRRINDRRLRRTTSLTKLLSEQQPPQRCLCRWSRFDQRNGRSINMCKDWVWLGNAFKWWDKQKLGFNDSQYEDWGYHWQIIVILCYVIPTAASTHKYGKKVPWRKSRWVAESHRTPNSDALLQQPQKLLRVITFAGRGRGCVEQSYHIFMVFGRFSFDDDPNKTGVILIMIC